MDINFSAFREPRGVMRVLHFIFSICAFATVTGYTGYVTFSCEKDEVVKKRVEYPFQLHYLSINISSCTTSIWGDYSSDAKYFVATGVLSMLYSVGISFVYIKFDELYKGNSRVPLTDFLVTVIFGVLWLSSSAAWANSLSGLKAVVQPTIKEDCHCVVSPCNFSTLNISVILGFLNFFLWAADLWFLYKETQWFQGNQQKEASEI